MTDKRQKLTNNRHTMPVVRSQMLSLNLTIEQIVQIIQIKWNTTECEIELRRSKKNLAQHVCRAADQTVCFGEP